MKGHSHRTIPRQDSQLRRCCILFRGQRGHEQNEEALQEKVEDCPQGETVLSTKIYQEPGRGQEIRLVGNKDEDGDGDGDGDGEGYGNGSGNEKNGFN